MSSSAAGPPYTCSDFRGFQKLVAEVGLGRAGIVLGLEASRVR